MDQQAFDTFISNEYRKNVGNLIAVLINIFGPENLEIVEDAVQDAMLEAIKNWKEKGIPDNPSAWLMRTSKNKVLNVLKRTEYNYKFQNREQFLLKQEELKNIHEELITDSSIQDDLLRMMFVCCNPAIGKESQATLVLKTLCGFSILEISKAFLTNEETISKRLVRARQQIRELNLSFEIPPDFEIGNRLDGLLETIYLLFNEGYSATSGSEPIRLDLCAEAIRLCRILIEHKSGESGASYSLMALLCFNAARLNGRISPEGEILLLDKQDRTKWNYPLINKGLRYLQKASSIGTINTYYIQAAISGQHCLASSFQHTNWREILNLYNLLIRIDHSPVVQLNRIVAVSKVYGSGQALRELEVLTNVGKLSNYYPYYGLRGELYMELMEWDEAILNFNTALQLTQNLKEKSIIDQKISFCYRNKK